MKKLIPILLSAVMLLSSLTACGGADDRLSVTTAKVKGTDALLTADYVGVIHAAKTMAVFSTVSAKITSVNVKLGQPVKAGDVLMQLDTSDAALSLKQAQAALDTANITEQKIISAANKQSLQQASQALSAAQNELHDAQANYAAIKKQYDQNIPFAAAQTAYNKAKSDYDKEKLMLSTGAASQYDLKNAQDTLNSAAAQLQSAKDAAQNTLYAADTRQKNAQNALDTAQQNNTLTLQAINPDNIASAKAGVDSAQAAVLIARKHISDSTVRAAIDGTIGTVNVKAGDLASPQSPAFQIVGNSAMEADVSVTENRVRKLETGSKASVCPGSTGDNIDGTVSEISPMGVNGMFLVKIAIGNSENLKDGMQASIHFPETGDSGTVLVPSRSVLSRDGTKIVFAVREGKAAQVTVTTGETQGAYVAVKGLAAGDEVLVQGVNKAKNGQELHIVSNTNG